MSSSERSGPPGTWVWSAGVAKGFHGNDVFQRGHVGINGLKYHLYHTMTLKLFTADHEALAGCDMVG